MYAPLTTTTISTVGRMNLLLLFGSDPIPPMLAPSLTEHLHSRLDGFKTPSARVLFALRRAVPGIGFNGFRECVRKAIWSEATGQFLDADNHMARVQARMRRRFGSVRTRRFF